MNTISTITGEIALSDYADAMSEVGELVQFQRNIAVPPAVANWQTYATARCRVVDYDFRPTPLSGAITQDERMVIALASDFAGAPLSPPKTGDKAVVRGKICDVKEVDDSTRRITGVLLAYEIRIKG